VRPHIHGIAFTDPVYPIHAFGGTEPLCAECREPKAAHDPGERPIEIAGVRCTRCTRRGESMWCRCSRAAVIADLRDLLAEARTMRRDSVDYYHGADVAIRLDAAAAIRRTLCVRAPMAPASRGIT
jgi:hypothetical protein